jgi:hypothetical protein
MSAAIDLLEERIGAVADLVRHLRQEVARLEHELAELPSPPPHELSPPPTPVPPVPEEGLLEEISRLREERAAVRERIRGLIREIDQVSW